MSKLAKFTYYTGYDDEGSTTSNSEDEETAQAKEKIKVTKKNKPVTSGNISSSEEEQAFQQIVASPKKKKVLTKETNDNEFENEMEKELDLIVKRSLNHDPSQTQDVVMTSPTKQTTDAKQAKKAIKTKNELEEDEDNFDEEEYAELKLPPRPSNDELLYDPHMDDRDQNWLNQRRKTCKKQTSTESKKIVYEDAKSDAVLNCPCCMTMLCMDCQRHERFLTQYRAMFIFNCTIDRNQRVKYPKSGKGKLKEASDTTSENECDVYYVVLCSNCKTRVGVYEEAEEMYHFHNVLSSYS